ncbi:MAG: hypothetical protein R8K46_08950 [Mariprofundaceae bacterium]
MPVARGWLVVLLMLMSLGACALEINEENLSSKASASKSEVLVRLCADTSLRQAEIILVRRSLWISKHLSANLLTVEWGDERSVSDVLGELENVSGICTAQPNYDYGIAPAD